MTAFRPALATALLLATSTAPAAAPEAPRTVDLPLAADDVIPTGNDWLSLPAIRAADGALETINVLSTRYRGLIEFAGPGQRPLLTPFLEVDGARRPLSGLTWSEADYWIPTATMTADGLRLRLTYAVPPKARAAIVRFQVTNLRATPVMLAPGMDLAWGATHRVTYAPEPLSGHRFRTPTPIDTDMEVFQYATDDTHFAWGFGHVGSEAKFGDDPANPSLVARHPATLGPGQTLDIHFTLGVGLEEYSAAYAMRVLNKRIGRDGLDAVIAAAGDDAHRRTRTTGKPDLDRVMNRNLLFTSYYAWGHALDSEQFVGVTSRSNRYYVSAAYWDRDALLWSFPALLATDPARAREALDYALGIQGRNAGIHSRFIDGAVLEDGLELDELVAPIIALAGYVGATGDMAAYTRHRETVSGLLARLDAERDPATGLYRTFQDAQDEFVRKPLSIYDNALTWKALRDLATLEQRAGEPAAATRLRASAAALHAAIQHFGIRTGAPGTTGPIYAAHVTATDGDFLDVPPGSLMKLPALGFVAQNDPVFRRTYDWLHGPSHPYSFAGQPYALPGSYRLPFTTSWLVADHLRLAAGRTQALKILLESPWDGGIITEGVKPDTGRPDHAGLAFATAAGYVASTICEQFCIDRPSAPPAAPAK